nr:enhanced entry virulence factor RtxA [Legionella pneumophila]
MLVESVIGIVRAVNGLLEKVNAQGQASLVKSGARLEEGDVLTLLSGEAYIQFIHGFPEALALGKPVKLDGVSPTLQYGMEDLNEQLVQEAIAKGIDPSLILDVLGSAAAGAVAVGSGGDAFIIDPLFGFGQVTAGYPTGPISFAYEADTQHLFWYVPEETGVIAESELASEPESFPQIPQFNTNQAVLTVFEDALPSGIPDSAGQARTASSSLSTLLTSSPDVAASFVFNTNYSVLPKLTSGGTELVYSLSPDKRTLSASIPGGPPVMQFKLTADGQLTQTLMDSIDHPTADGDDGEWMRFDLSLFIDVTFRTSDGTVLESRTLPANAVIAGIQDDVPIARAELTNNEILLDETVGMKVGDADAANDDFNPTTTADPFNNTYGRPIGLVQNANLLDTSTSEMGGDAKNATMTHLLKITNAVSGLQATDGTPINLFLESNGDITGRAGDASAPTIFAIRIDPNTGAITVAQYGSIKQFDTSSHDEAVDLTGRISAVVTAKDSDGDVSNAEIPIGQLIIFEDDGPKADAKAGAVAGAVLDESPAEGGLNNPVTIAASAISGLFETPDYGADGLGSVAYSLSGTDGAGTGLWLTGQSGAANEIRLVKVSDTEYEGRVGGAAGTLAFEVTIDSNTGAVTVTQFATLEHTTDGSSAAAHDDALSLGGAAGIFVVQTVTDADGDTDAATSANALNISFEDDGPKADAKAGAVAGAVLDESPAEGGLNNPVTIAASAISGLFETPDYGADGLGSVAYSLSGTDGAGTGLWLTGQSGAANEIRLVKVSDTEYEGRVGGAAGTLAFEVTIDSNTGAVTVTQFATLEHTTDGSSAAAHDDALSLGGAAGIFVVQTVTDADGDTDAATSANALNISFEDDGPKADAKAGAVAGAVLDESPAEGGLNNPVTIAASAISGLFETPDYGADGLGSVAYSLSGTDGAGTGLWLTGQSGAANEIRLVKVSDTEYEGRVGGAAGTLAFEVTIDSNTGAVTVTQFATLEHTTDGSSAAAHDDALSLGGAAGIFVVQTVTDADGDTDAATSANALNISFEDDGPKADAKAGAVAGAVLDESPAEGGLNNPVTIAASAISGLFETPDYGADGLGSVAYSLSGTDGAGTGLWLTGQSGAANEIRLVKVSDTEYEGRVGGAAGTLAFEVTIDSNTGAVTVTQFATLEHTTDGSSAVAHDDALSLGGAAGIFVVQTVTDADGDTDAATSANALNISFEDDGPKADAKAGAVAGAVLDESPAEGGLNNPVTIAASAISGLFETPDYGADGLGSVAYSLSGTDGAGTGLWLTGQSGAANEIRLVKVSDTEYEGRVGGAAGTLAFEVTIDSNTGAVTVTQFATLEHTTDGSSAAAHDDALSLGGAAGIFVVQTVTDADGDTDAATSANALNISFEDDGPKADAKAGAVAGAVLDESPAEGGLNNPVTIAASAISGLFETPDYGADGLGSVAYSLSGTDGAGTGLWLTGQSGAANEIRLVKVSDTEYEGRVGGAAGTLAFEVTIDSNTGAVTVTQFATLEHTTDGSSAAAHDDALSLGGAAGIFVVQTVTDADGDTDAATSANALNISFEDDGPKADAKAGAVAGAVLDESPAEGGLNNPVTIAASAIAGLFETPDYGADGLGSVAYSLSGTDGAGTGLWLTGQSGAANEIRLVKVSDTEYEGRVGGAAGTLAFEVTIDSNTGAVTVTQFATLEHTTDGSSAVAHDDALSLGGAAGIFVVQTVTDADGDTDAATSANALNISFEDDGPKADAKAGAVAGAVLDESPAEGGLNNPVTIAASAISGLFETPDYGADGLGSVAYSLSGTDGAGTGLWLTGQSGAANEIRLVKVSDTEYEGRVGGAAGTLAFEVTIDSNTGAVTVTQFATLEHTTDGSSAAAHDDALSLGGAAGIFVVQTVTDADGDTDAATSANALNISFEDDGPKADAKAGAVAGAVLDESPAEGGLNNPVTIAASAISGLFETPDYGADGLGSVAYSLSGTDGAGTGLWLTGQSGAANEIRLVKVSDTEYEGRVGGAAGTLAFEVTIDSNTGAVTVTQFATLEHTTDGSSAAAHDDALSLGGAAGIFVVQTVTDADGDTDAATSANALNISFEDDGPKADAKAGAVAGAVLDESPAEGGLNNPVTIAASAISGLFETPDYGADGLGSVAYSLSGTDGAGTGLWLTGQSGAANEIRLVKVSDTEYEGRVGGAAGTLAFEVTIDSNTGAVTVTQFATLEHTTDGSSAAAHDDALSLGGAAGIFVVQTVTDADGDTDAATSANALNISFEDDGPKADAKAGAVAGAVLDESPAEGGLNNPVTIAASAISGLFETPDYGADGLGSVAYSLSGTDGAGTGLWLTGQSGAANEIRLVKVSDTEYEGRVGGAAGTLAFEVTIDSNTGAVTVTQFATLEHTTDGSSAAAHDDALSLGGAAGIFVVQTVTDADGDTDAATSANALNISFEDDGPKADAKAGAVAGAVLDESPAEGGLNNPVTIAASAISGLFETPDYGADGLGSVAYSLSGTDGAGTGLWLTGQSGAANEIRLVKVSDTEYEGRVGGAAGTLAFEVTIDSNTGAVTVTQFATLEHTTDGSSAAAHDDALSLGGAAGIFVVQTVTDADGDTDAATSANALNISFEDDGPKADAKAGAVAGAVLDESPAEGGLNNPVTIAASAISGLFETPDYGADGLGSVAYSLSGTDGAGTGLWLTGQSGAANEIRLVKVSDTEYEGRVGGAAGTLAFEVTIDSNTGAVTVTQFATLEHTTDGSSAAAHDDALSLGGAAGIFVVQTVTDADGDTDAATSANALNISFEDDGPKADAKAGAVAGAVLDESPAEGGLNNPVTIAASAIAGLFETPDYGADGLGSVAYSLSGTDGAGTGLWLTGQSGAANEIRLVKVSDTEYEGRVGGAAGTLAFEVTIDSNTGAVTVTQFATLEHTTDGSSAAAHDDALSLGGAAGIFVVQTVTDADGDTDAATSANALNISFEDDGPKADAKAGAVAGAVLDESPAEGGLNNPVTIAASAIAGLFETPDYGADGLGSVAYSLSGTDGAGTGLWLTGQSGAANEIRLVKVSDTEYEGRVGGAAGTLAFEVTIDSNTGAVTVTQFATLEHTTDGSSAVAHDDALSLGGAAGIFVVQTVTDADGDTDAATSANALNISFEDDGPVASTNKLTGVVDEDGLAGGIAGGTGDVAGQAVAASGNVAALFQSGADAPLSYSLNSSTSGLPALSSGGVALTYAVSGNTLTASAGSTQVFTFTLNANGNYTFTLLAKLDHPAGADENDIAINLGSVIRATDSDGDTVVAAADGLVITVDDDTPVASATKLTGVVDEDGLAGGIAGGTGDVAGQAVAASGNVAALFQSGADAPLSYSLNSSTSGLPALSSGGVALTYAVSGNTLTASAGSTQVFTFTLNANGNYTFTLLAKLDHPAGADENDIAINLGSVIRATDSDGDTVVAAADGLVITVDDDTPVASATKLTGVVDEDGLAGGIAGGTGDVAGQAVAASGNVAALFQSGADAPLSYSLNSSTSGLPALSSGGVALTYAVSGNTLTASAGSTQVFTFTLNANGNYTFTLLAKLDHPAGADENDIAINLGSVIRATDSDGDTVVAAADGLVITVDDDTPVASATKLTGVVDEDGLAGGIAGGTGDVAGQAVAASGNVAALFQSGADAPLSYSLNSSTSGLPALSSGGVALTYAVSGNTLTASAGSTQVFTFTLNANGNYTFTLLAKLDHPAGADENDIAINLGSVIRATDSDGDTVVAAADGLVITVDDDTPVASATKLTGVVDEDGLAGGIAGGTGDVAGQAVAASGNVAALFQSGADAPLSYSLNSSTSGLPALSSGGVALTYAVSGNTLTASAGSTQVFTFTLNANGNYTFTLLAKLDHPAGADENDIAINLGSVIRATDSDGDTVVAAADGLVITVDDDTPVASATKLTGVVDEDGLAGGIAGGTGDVAGQAVAASGNVAALFQSGADAPLSYSLNSSTSGLPALSSGGVALTYAVSGNTLTASAGSTQVFTFTLNANGNYTFTLLAKLDHPAGADENDIAINLGSVIRATDSDGDTVVAAADGLVITVDDDTPVASATKLTGVVDEDGLAGGIAGGTGDVAGQAVAASGNVAALFQSGADAPLSYSLNSSTSGLPALSSGGVALTYAVSGNTLTASAGSTQVFTFTLNANGNYTFTLLAKLDHPAGADENDIAINLGSVIRATDSDGDTVVAAADGLVITVDDDTPVAFTPEEGFVTNQAGIVRTFDLDFDANIDNNVGADQLGTIAFSGITNGQLVTGTVDGVPNQTLTSGGSAIHYYVSGNNVVEGWINGGPGDVGSSIVFRTTLQPDMNYNASNDTYKFELFQPISTSTNVSITNFNGVNATSREFIYLENASAPGEDILFSGYIRNDNGTFTDATVNTSTQGIGVNNQNMNDRENLRLDFVRNASTNGTTSNMTYEYDDHYTVNNFSFKIVQVTGSPPAGSIEVWVRAYNADDDDPTNNTVSAANNLAHQDALRDDPQVALTQILVNGVPVTPTAVNASGGYLISGLNLNDTITLRSANGYDRVEIENARSGAHGVSNSSLNGETFDIGLFSYDTIKTTPSEININMGLSLTDSDGDKITSSIEINLSPSVFKVGENVDDTSISNVPHRVGGDTGVIDGSAGADILIGDVGGVEIVGTTARIAFILDESGSMGQNFGGTTRLEVLKQTMTDILTELSNTPNASITVHLVKFASVVNGTGTFEITGGELQQALDFISGLQIQQGLLAGTNYEAALGQTLQWYNSQSGTVDVQQTLFFTDGAPTFYMDGNSTEYTNIARVYGNGSQTEEVLWENLFGEHAGGQATSDRINNLTESDPRDLDGTQSYSVDTNGDGIFETQSVNSRSSGTTQTTNDYVRSIADTFNEVDALQAYGPLRAVSIADNFSVYLQEIDSTGQPYIADSPEVLQDILDELNPFNVLLAAGSDTIQANEENDLIFGDVLFTDKLAEDEGLDLPKGSGWAVFEELEANHGWSRQDTLDYIKNHADELGRETVLSSGSKRSGGHDTISGGQGDDRIYGQEGNDIIDAGSGDDVIVGGTGNDTLTGGSGADQFILVKGQGGASAGAAPIDTITDFEVNIDKIVINGNNITGVSVSTPVSNTYTITVNYSDAATEHFKVTLSNGAVLNDSGKTHLNGVVISGGTATIDGTIVGAVLYLDLNANNQEDEGERLGITNQYGHVEWVVDLSKFDVNGDGQYVIGEARAVQTGGFDIDTGLSYEINLYGPVGSAVISPLTSLLQAQLEAGMDYETANAALVARLGLPEGTQIISFNPITGSGEVLAQNAGVMTAAIQFAEIAAIHYSTDESHVSFAVFEAISQALLDLPEGIVADFSDQGFLQSISNHLGLDALVTADIIDYMAAGQKALEASILTLAPGEDALTAISKIQHVTQGIYAQAIEMALIGYLPLDALKNMSAVLKAYADGDITDEQLNSFEDKLSAVVVNWEENNVADTSHQATLQTEHTVDDPSAKSEVNHELAQEVNAVINDFMDEHNIPVNYYDQQAQMAQEAQEEQQPVEAQAEETTMHDEVVQDLLLDDHSLTMLANNPELNGGNGNDVLHGTTGNDFIRGGQGNDMMTGGGGVDTFFWLSGDDDGGVDTITDFKANPVDQSSDASVLNLSDLLSDADLETNSLDNYLNVSTTEEGDTAIKVDPNGNGNFDAPAQTIILEDVDLTAVFATNNSHDIVNQMIANGNLVVEQ